MDVVDAGECLPNGPEVRVLPGTTLAFMAKHRRAIGVDDRSAEEFNTLKRGRDEASPTLNVGSTFTRSNLEPQSKLLSESRAPAQKQVAHVREGE
jgi:hypothetical protein